MAFLFSRTKADSNYDAVKKATDSVVALHGPPSSPAVGVTIMKRKDLC